MNDILIKQFMKSFELNRLQAGLIQSAFYMGYFLLAIPAGFL
jgi:FHS family L-fucose permease-like MFS transporter